jgi:hypothetical protein
MMANKASTGTNIKTSAYFARMLQSFPASYTVWKDSDGNYYAESNMEDGTTYPDYGPSTNAATVIQAAIDAISSVGGKIFFRRGTYSIGTQVTYYANQIFEGEGESETFLTFSGSSGYMLAPADNTLANKHFQIRNMALVCTLVNTGALDLTSFSFCTFDHVLFASSASTTNISTETARIGAYLDENTGVANSAFFNIFVSCDFQQWHKGIEHSNANINTVLNCRFQTCYIGYDMNFGNANSVINSDFEGNTYGLNYGGTANTNQIIGGYYENNSTKDINISGTGSVVEAFGLRWGSPGAYVSVYLGTSAELRVAGKAKQARTAIAVDLSGAATTLVALHSETKALLTRATLLYTEASSADAGITIKIGKETDDDYYYTGTTETGESQWYTKTVTLLAKDIAAGDTVLFYSAGSKVGTGEIILILDYLDDVSGAN